MGPRAQLTSAGYWLFLPQMMGWPHRHWGDGSIDRPLTPGLTLLLMTQRARMMQEYRMMVQET